MTTHRIHTWESRAIRRFDRFASPAADVFTRWMRPLFAVTIAATVILFAGVLTDSVETVRPVVFTLAGIFGAAFFGLLLLPLYVMIVAGPYFWTFQSLVRQGRDKWSSRLIAFLLQVGYLTVVGGATTWYVWPR